MEIKSKGRNVGFGIPVPAKPSEYDVNDPFYGDLKIKRGNFVGVVASAKAAKTAIVVVDRTIHIKKYNRYMKQRSRIAVHNPVSVNAKEGDIVRVFETRPLSKTKHHVIVQVIDKETVVTGQDLAQEAKDEKKVKVEKEQ